MRQSGRDKASPVRLRRPLFTVGMTYGGCLFLAAAVGFHTSLIGAAVAALLFLVALAVRRLRHNEVLLAALLTAVAAFCVFAGREYLTVRPLQRHGGEETTLTLWLESEQGYTERALAYYARVEEGPLPRDTRVLVWVRTGEEAPRLYDEITGRMTLFASDQYRADGVYLTAAAAGCQVRESARRPAAMPLEEVRNVFLDRTGEYLPGEAGAMVRAICFGDRTALSSDTKEGLAQAGLTHLTAVSGFHMTVITFGFFRLLVLMRMKKNRAALWALPLPLLFAALTGFSYSAIRSGIMCLFLLSGYLFRRRADGRNSLGAAVAVILLWDPAAVYDLGFLLSACATLGILVTVEHITVRPGIRGRIRLVLTMCLAALASTLPLTARYFGRLPLLAPLTNLLGEPLAALTVVTGCLATVLAGVPFLGFIVKPLFLLAGGACRLLLWIKDLAASLGTVLTLDRPYLLLWATGLPLLLAAGYWLRGRRGLRTAALMLTVALLAGMVVDALGMRGVTALFCREAEKGSMVLLVRDGRQVLVLTGAPRKEEVDRLLRRQEGGEADLLICTDAPPEGLTAAEQLQNGSARFWNDCSVETQAGWTFLRVGDTGVLICPREGNLADSPFPLQQTTVTVFDRIPPEESDSLIALQGVVCCGKEDLASLGGLVPWGRYPIAVTGGEPVILYTRGLGDCTVKEKGYALE